jgi:hypothetical protein
MQVPDQVDTFHLRELADDIDKRASRIMADDFNRVVPAAALAEVKAKIHQEVSTLCVEFANDLMELKARLGTQEILSPDRRIPTVEELAADLPSIYTPPQGEDGSEPSAGARQQWSLALLNWVVHSWLQVYGNLMRRLDPTRPVAPQVEMELDDETRLVEVPLPRELDLMADTWQLAKRLTFEYIHVKAEVLRAFGHDVPGVCVNWEQEPDQAWRDAEKAFWSNNLYTPVLLARALRHAFLQALQLTGPAYPVDLGVLPTCQLPILAERVGLQLPFDAQLLGAIASHLDSCQSYCDTLSVSLLYPTYRIVGKVVRDLLALPKAPNLPEHAAAVLAEAMGAENEPQSEAGY